MSRRAPLPGAAELFRRTSNPVFEESPVPDAATDATLGNSHGKRSRPAEREPARGGSARRGSGRQKHDAKITVYLSGEELLAMEHARLALRGSHDLVVDRGRIVREAVSVLLADFDQHGEDSILVRRLRAGDLDAEEATS